MAKNKEMIKSKGWKGLLQGMEIERAGLRVEESSSISFGTYQKEVDKDGNERLVEVRNV